MGTLYEEDIAAWAMEQVDLLRSGQLALIDVEHIAEEIEDMNLSHRHQLAHRMAILLGHMLKWKYQPLRRGSSWEHTIRTQRGRITRLLKLMPSLRHLLDDPQWNKDVWDDAIDIAQTEAHLRNLPKSCPWTLEQIVADDFFPG